MLRLLARRLIQLPLILAVIFAVTFTLAWLVPGDPFSQPDRRPPKEVAEALKRKYNLDSPWVFAGSYLKNLFTKGDLGPSLSDKDHTVNEILARKLPISVAVGLAALIIALFLGLAAGIAGALRPGSPLDFASLGVALIGISLPSFVTGTLLLVLFAHALNFSVTSDWELPGWAIWTSQWWNDARTLGRAILPPAIALALAPAAYIARLIRLGLADIMQSDFIRTARAKGVSSTGVLFDHALKVAFLPVLSFLGPAAAATMTGSFVVEKIFEVPGIGRDFVNAVVTKDQFLILGLVLVYATMLIVFNMLVDIAYAWVDPRIDFDQGKPASA